MAKAKFTDKDLKRWAKTATETTYKVKVYKPTGVHAEFEKPIVYIVPKKDTKHLYRVEFTTTRKKTNVSGGTVQKLLGKEVIATKVFQVVGNNVRT